MKQHNKADLDQEAGVIFHRLECNYSAAESMCIVSELIKILSFVTLKRGDFDEF